MDITYVRNFPLDAQVIIEVFASVDWHKDYDNICSAFKNSYYIVAFDGTKVVGFARAISDGHYYTGIYDVIVRPEYQKQGIGRKLVETLLDEFRGTYFFLSYTEGKKAFYEKCGFAAIDNAMWIPRNKS